MELLVFYVYFTTGYAGWFDVVVMTSVGHISKVKLRRARLVLGLVTTFDESIIPVFSRPPRSIQPGHPSVGG